MFVGIDVATERLNCVALGPDRAVARSAIFAADELAALSQWVGDADVVAIDAPSSLSTGPHEWDDSLSPKFKHARCAELALGREHKIWVPWVTPTAAPVPGWMATGFRVYSELRATSSARLIEVFPHAGFRVLTRPARLAKKASVAGLRQRADALLAAGASVEHAHMWSHDSLDAGVAALVALQHHTGTALRVTCDHDDSEIWLPGFLAAQAG